MKITKVKLYNIGPYRSENNTFDIDVSKNKNIILIGGKNGAGKTTLLNSIKIGLFGNYAFGLKTNGSTYLNSLGKLFNYVESKKKISNYEIMIEFKLIENYIENTYEFKRSWKKVDNSINETLKVKRNNLYLDEEETELIQTKLKEIMPPSVIDTMLFDGEKIAQIIDDNKISEYLKEMINVNFNLNIFEKMEDDINFYIDKEKNRKVFSAAEINVLEYRNKYKECQKNLKNLTDIYEKYQKSENEQKFKLRNLLKKFENYGGLDDKERFAMRSSLEMLESTRKDNLSTIKNFLEDDIVFYLNIDRIRHIEEDIKKEKPKILLEYVDEIAELLGDKKVESIRKELNKITGKENIEIKYTSTPKLTKLIAELFKRYAELTIDDLKFILKNSREDLNNTKIYKKIIGNNENSIDLQKLLKEIKIIEISIEEIREKIKEVEKKLKKASQDVNSSLLELETIEKKLDGERKEENSFFIARKLLKISEEYQSKQVSNCLTKIADLAVKKFDEINKKENYISKIIIDKNTYDVVLYDNNGLEKDITILSAGEKQLLISAIIWAIFKLSDRNNMFTFDTPLARLDKENRTLFVEKILCTISDQVMILSTDEEIVGDLYKIIRSNISKQYILLNDEKIGKTELKEAYF